MSHLRIGTGMYGHMQEQLNNPWGIAYNPYSHQLLVGDGANDRIQRFEIEYDPVFPQSQRIKFLSTIGSKGTAPLQFQSVRSVCYQPSSDHILACDEYNHRVQILNEEGTKHLVSIGHPNHQPGDRAGEFRDPLGVNCQADGSIGVADTYNHRIQLFDSRATFLRTWKMIG